ncbi:hypothetical protein EVJ58_g3735 [Rhodofomes roseus]|uniref:Peptidase C14 caspase domain-containing protein n=1 Tax=Rhodofomes roseus TaxID=34475 RepID=A0A4Y9YM14_9APHY|nr:hypothetical protein EVJ58_g3735 [Rhodofomes roseus]
MATRVFAFIIGVDKYKSGRIWNLESCVDDAKSIKHWLTRDLHVPRDQICLLLDSDATKRRIEEKFTGHLINNPAIEPGDAILIYFAGHGSRVRSPAGWYQHGLGEVEVLCPYDHDTRAAEGRVAGISDRSLHAMIEDLCRTKGDNITLMLDTCFSPLRSYEGAGPKHVRYTATVKASPNDLLSGLWRSATKQPGQKNASRGFTGSSYASHVVLAACGSGWFACEGKSGGNFTHALMTLKERVALHKLTYDDLNTEISTLMVDHQSAVSLGRHTDRILFDGIPFVPDGRYISIDVYDDEKVRVEAGAIHGIMEGTEFSIHHHNHRGSLNPTLALYSAVEVFPTWCLAQCKSSAKSALAVRHGWARITRWNNRTPFRVHIRKSLFSLCRRFRLRHLIPSDAEQAVTKAGLNMLRVKTAYQADVSVQLRKRELVLERHDPVIASNARRVIRLPSRRTSGDVKIVDDAARFHLHLHRKNPENPLLDLVAMELYRLDASTWKRTSCNMIVDGTAELEDDEKSSIYAVVLHNYSDYDLWPYLAYMDASGYGINMVYHPNPSASKDPPLRKNSFMVIGETESEALSFSLAGGADVGAGFLKLFVSTTFTPMRFIEQGSLAAVPSNTPRGAGRPPFSSNPDAGTAEVWDSIVACVTVVRKVDKDC